MVEFRHMFLVTTACFCKLVFLFYVTRKCKNPFLMGVGCEYKPTCIYGMQNEALYVHKLH